jgi:hypothetical protein
LPPCPAESTALSARFLANDAKILKLAQREYTGWDTNKIEQYFRHCEQYAPVACENATAVLALAGSSLLSYTGAKIISDQEADVMVRLTLVAFVISVIALPAFSGTHKEAYPNACSDIWAAVKDTLGNPENYTIKIADESRMTASYSVKHSAHVTITGALRQRPNTVSLNSTGTGCQMEVQSNYSGFEHNDAGDFIKRVNESLAKLKGAAASDTAKPADAK